jgi:N utilization substance protein B
MSKKPSFAGRKKARRYALLALYGWMLSDNPVKDIENYVLSEHSEADFDQEYFRALLYGIPEQTGDLELEMVPYVSRKVQDLDPIELTILRISTFELKNRLDVPYKVIINEALELAKTFGATDSHKFVNGVLDKMVRKLRPLEL